LSGEASIVKAWRLLRWAILIAIIGVLLASPESVSAPTKLLTAFCGLIVFSTWLAAGTVRWIKREDKAPAWDEIQSAPPVVPEPPFRGSGPVARVLKDRFAKWNLNRKHRNDDAAYLNMMGELFDIGTSHTPRDPVEAMRWYMAAAGGDPTQDRGHQYAKLRIAEMYEDGEGVPRDLDKAGRIYKTISNFPSAMLYFAIAHVDGRGVTRDYVEAYRLLLLADKARSWHPPTRKQIETDPQSHRENRRHIKVRELMALLESRMAPEQLFKARDAAREWWNAHR
jgi:hypothetical protein